MTKLDSSTPYFPYSPEAATPLERQSRLLGTCDWQGRTDPDYDTTIHQTPHEKRKWCANWRPTDAASVSPAVPPQPEYEQQYNQAVGEYDRLQQSNPFGSPAVQPGASEPECTEDCVRKGYADPNCAKHGQKSSMGAQTAEQFYNLNPESYSYACNAPHVWKFAEAYAERLREELRQVKQEVDLNFQDLCDWRSKSLACGLEQSRTPAPEYSLQLTNKLAEELREENQRLTRESNQTCKTQYHMYVWTKEPFFYAVAQARSVDEARKLMLEEVGESGDGSCPELDKARTFIRDLQPYIFHRENATFGLTDSAELREQEDHSEKLRKRAESVEQERDQLRTEVERLNAKMREEREEHKKIAGTPMVNLWEILKKEQAHSLQIERELAELRTKLGEQEQIEANAAKDRAMRERALAELASLREEHSTALGELEQIIVQQKEHIERLLTPVAAPSRAEEEK